MTSPAVSSGSKKSKKTPARELDTSNATRGVWLVKVPNYLAEAWKDAEPESELGKIKLGSGSKPGMTFTLSDALAKKAHTKIGLEIPKGHRVHTQDTTKQSLSVFSEAVESQQLQVEGKVTQRTDLQPPLDSVAYMKLKQHQIKEAGKTKNSPSIQLDHTPIAKPPKETRAVKQLDKRARGDREMVLDLIFSSFQTHEFYNFKDLVHKTAQPPSYLKEILKEVCVYNTRAPHKNMWQLKAEYKHYQKKDTSSS